MLSQWLWIIVCNAEPVVVNQGLLYCAKRCESWRVILIQWLWNMVCYADPVVVNHGVLYWSSGCETWCAMLIQWLWIMVCYATPVVVNHGELWWASSCESCVLPVCRLNIYALFIIWKNKAVLYKQWFAIYWCLLKQVRLYLKTLKFIDVSVVIAI
jgi:hypothetical protein